MAHPRWFACLLVALAFSRVGLCQCTTPQLNEPLRQTARLYVPLVVDLSSDGILDLVLGDTVSLGRGDGTFAEPTPISPGEAGGTGRMVADVNNDGRPDVGLAGGDVALPCGGGSAGGVALVSLPNGLFSAVLGMSGVDQSVAVDWNGDGFVDLVGGYEFDGHCSAAVKYGDGTGSFGDAVELGAASLEGGESLIAVAAFDGDGKLDFAYTTHFDDSNRRLRILRHGLGNALVGAPLYEVNFSKGATRILRTGDFDNDGRPDLLVQSGDAFLAFLNRGGGSFELVRSPLDGIGVRDYALADFNGDGALDIAVLRTSRPGFSSSIVVLCGDGAGRFSACATVPLATAFSGWVRVGDFNGDGRPDIAVDGGTAGFFVALNDCPSSGRLMGVVPSVASASGLFGAHFRTRLSLENPCVEQIDGRLVFHLRGRPDSDSDPSLPFKLGPSEVLQFEDVVSEMGESGSGSLDVRVANGRDPIVRAEIFNSSFGDRVRGGVEPAVAPREALTVGQGGDLAAPVDSAKSRFTIGLRSLAEGVSLRATLRDPLGHLVTVAHRSFGPYRTVQEPAQEFLGGVELAGRETVSISILSGSAIVFGTTADNATSTPAIQIATRR